MTTVRHVTSVSVPQHILDSQTIDYGSLYKRCSMFSWFFSQEDLENKIFPSTGKGKEHWNEGGPNYWSIERKFAAGGLRNEDHKRSRLFMPIATVGYRLDLDNGKVALQYMVKCIAFFESNFPNESLSPFVIYIKERTFDLQLVRNDESVVVTLMPRKK